MRQALLALATATTTASGCVWYVPALVTLRAGADRPASHRRAAVACLTGWGTAGIVTVLLLLTRTWWIPCAAAGTGGLLTAALMTRAAALRRREAREAALQWTRLGQGATLPAADRGRHIVAVLVGAGLVAATLAAAAGASFAAGHTTSRPVALTVPAAVLGAFLASAVAYARVARRRTGTRRAPTPGRSRG